MKGLKVLPVPRWVEWDLDADEVRLENRTLGSKLAPEIPPVFHRDGFYFDRIKSRTWMEIGGRAYAYNDVGGFKYDISNLNPRTLPRASVVAALLVLKKEGMLSPAQVHELDVLGDWLMLRSIKTGGLK